LQCLYATRRSTDRADLGRGVHHTLQRHQYRIIVRTRILYGWAGGLCKRLYSPGLPPRHQGPSCYASQCPRLGRSSGRPLWSPWPARWPPSVNVGWCCPAAIGRLRSWRRR
jgi:hypothetical protein